LLPFRSFATRTTYEQLEQRVKGLEKEVFEHKLAEEAQRESTRRLELAYDQSIIYAKQLNKEVAERKRVEEALQEARNQLEDRVEERTAELSKTNALLKQEIVERRIAEGALRESEVRLKSVLDTIQAGIVVIDPETHVIVGVNAAAGKMVGAPREQILGSVCHGHICSADKDQCPITDLGQSLENAEQVLLTTSGKKMPILKTVVSVVLAGREHLLESFIDITERKRAEEALRASEKQLCQHEKQVGILKFANDVALKLMHELRNPLVAVGGFSRLISSKDYPEDKMKEYASIILEQSMRLDGAVNEILAHLKVAAKQV